MSRTAGGGRTSEPSDMLVLAPLGFEARALRRGLPASGVLVERTGMGAKRAARAAILAAEIPARAVAIAGVCGALDPSLRPGDVVVASEVRGPGGTNITTIPGAGLLLSAVRKLGLTATMGPILSMDHLASRREREQLASTGAVAVDMESAWLAPAAAGRPLVVLRVVSDTPDRPLYRVAATVSGGLTALRTLRQSAPALASWGAAAGPRTVLLAGPRSFCAGVERAIEIVERALDRYGPPVYVRKQIVHNVHVVRDLEERGAIFVDALHEVPKRGLVVFSAHGVSPQVRSEARERSLKVIDATCPLVTKVHSEAKRFARAGYTIVLVGHEGHEEVEGTTGEAPEAIRLIERADQIDDLELPDGGGRVAYLTQTTLAVDEVTDVVEALRTKFPHLTGPGSDDICYATSNRQDAVKVLARESDVMLVIGSGNSSNSKRLVEVSAREGCPAWLVDDETEIDPAWLVGARTVTVTAGASAPEVLVDRVVGALRGLGPVTVEERQVMDESVQFTLPIELR
ncbi:MAG: 4-hydroxy-3-methylbut-2-enyl diphosphate reductase [Actinomycetota bacterium]|nr:4-hydroxy-3-methylbut-2-enyl diphosphate reductase [Actinomycetota bacterium]